MASKKVLGRGLGAFFPEYDDDKSSSESSSQNNDASSAYVDPKKRVNVVLHIPVENIRPNPHQPRSEFDEDRLQELAESIDKHGLIQPITVRYIGEERFELISGERRLRATKLAGKNDIPSYVREVDDDDIIAYALIENIQREQLNPIEIALGYERLIDECNYTQEEVAKKVGKKRTTVTNMIRLLNLPPFIQAALRDRKISMGHARALLGLDNTKEQQKMLKKAVEKGYSVRQIEDEIRKLNNKSKNKKSKPKPKSENDALYRDISDRLRRTFSTKVNIKPKRKGGEIRIEYYSEEELDRILNLFDSIS